MSGEVRHLRLVTLVHSREVDLTLANLEQVLAALHESVDLCEDARLVENPRFVRHLVVEFLCLVVRFLPRLAACNALVQSRHARADVTVENAIQVDLVATTSNNLVAQLHPKYSTCIVYLSTRY